ARDLVLVHRRAEGSHQEGQAGARKRVHHEAWDAGHSLAPYPQGEFHVRRAHQLDVPWLREGSDGMNAEKRKRLEKNPFSTAYIKKEIRFYGLKEPYEKDGVSVQFHPLVGIKPDYLNVRFRLGPKNVPVLRIDGEIW